MKDKVLRTFKLKGVPYVEKEKTPFLNALHYKENGSETLENKVEKLIRKEVESGNF